jgi:2-haloalkanoic acid dehalogenase type II
LEIKAVLFDLGNTLVYQNPYEVFQKILGTHGITITIDEIKKAFTKTEREFNPERYSGLSAHEFYTQLNLHVLKHLGIKDPNLLRSLAEDIDFQWFKIAKICLYDDVKPTLEKLRKEGFKLGLITDGYRDELERMLSKFGLQDFFDVCVCADTIGKRKPNPQVFKYALDKLNVSPSETVFVGDRLDIDYLGAKEAGMTPILIQREGNREKVANVWVIRSLKEIFKILETIKESLTLNQLP